jgi:hypothetical protein
VESREEKVSLDGGSLWTQGGTLLLKLPNPCSITGLNKACFPMNSSRDGLTGVLVLTPESPDVQLSDRGMRESLLTACLELSKETLISLMC